MKINSQNRQINLDKDYNLEEIPRFCPYTAFDHLALAQAILYGMEIFLAKIVDTIIDSPECEKDEKFWIETQVNRIISYYLTWFKSIIREFEPSIRLTRVGTKAISLEIKLTIKFKEDENDYTYTYVFVKTKKGRLNENI